MFKRIRHIHFVGIGGIGMSGIAEVLLNLGYKVSGSDLKLTGVTQHLAELGAIVYEGHSAQSVTGADVVVISAAVKPNNPEVVEALHQQIPVIPRAEMLAELMRLKYGIAIAGAHGKTSTTSMIAHILHRADYDPTVVIGGKLGTLGSNARLGHGEFIVVEADESDGSFLKLSPTIAVVTNIDREHMDYYKSLDEICEYFAAFVNRVPFYGSVVVCLDDSNVQSIIPKIKRRTLTYGFSAQADVTAWNVKLTELFGSSFTVRFRGQELGKIELQVPGTHSVYNALAAICTCLDLEVPFDKIASALSNFRGADRRFQIKGEKKEVVVVDDYGHHPMEIRTVLAAAKTSLRRTVVLFQPHRYSRTKHLFEDFAKAFYEADVVCLTDVYPAGEEPIPGVNSETLSHAIERFGHRQVSYIGSLDRAAPALKALVKPGDLVLTLGAGNVWQAGEELLHLLER
ncbi:MAG: UDP-N-acetylmuramate--L-alanine ligase [Acidobacteria bacterium]|nr:UDP-N-acetylmuramate--L-alanine ligase [Acidobacteriota bacterium]